MSFLLALSMVITIAALAGFSMSLNSLGLLTQAQIGEVQNPISVQDYDTLKRCSPKLSERPDPIQYLTHFNCGRVSTDQGGGTLREFTIIAEENHEIPISNTGHVMQAWTFNGTIPGPTMRVTEGDHVKITLINSAGSEHAHTIHMHSIHASQTDGVDRPVLPGQSFTYDFIAQPAGVYPYHCHVDPVADHINRGLYGMLIIDPKTPRAQMAEMVMLMNGYDLNYEQEGPTVIEPVEEESEGETDGQESEILPEVNDAEDEATSADDDNIEADSMQSQQSLEAEEADDIEGMLELQAEEADDIEGVLEGEEQESEEEERDNEIYTVNGEAFLYMNHPIELEVGKQYRVFLVNMLEFDLVNSIHVHGAMFDYYPSGTSDTPSFQNDIVTLSQGDRGILEFSYHYPGQYMFHAHQVEFSDLGWMGFFDVGDGQSGSADEMPGQHHSGDDTDA